jgi:hypothetical protein
MQALRVFYDGACELDSPTVIARWRRRAPYCKTSQPLGGNDAKTTEFPSSALNVDCWQRGEDTRCESTTPNPNQSANAGRIPIDAQASTKKLLLFGNLLQFKDVTEAQMLWRMS